MCQPAEWAFKLEALVALAGKRVEERKMESLKKPVPGSQAQADLHRQIRLWSLRLQLYCRMRENFLKTGKWFGARRGFVLNYSSRSNLACCFSVKICEEDTPSMKAAILIGKLFFKIQ